MDRENWLKTDNVSKIFLATFNERDTRTLRVSCTLSEEADPELLKKALHRTIASRSLFQVKIRRGVFWHYIEHTEELPEVYEESGRPCPLLYGKNYRGTLHYMVTYYRRKISIDMFHVLTDGTGAMEFLNLLVLNYLRLKYPDELDGIYTGSSASAAVLEEDSFRQNYEKETASVTESRSGSARAYHIRGLKLPHSQLQFFRVRMPVAPLLERARENGVSLTSYISARLVAAMHRDMPASGRNLPVTVSIPVNLRKYFGSETSRNFFNSINVSHYHDEKGSFPELAASFEAKLRDGLTEENIRRQMNSYQKLEKLMVLRMVPLTLKQPVVRFFSGQEAKKVSAVISNVGVVKIPDEIKKYVEEYTVFCSHSDLYISMCSFGEYITFGITSGYRSTEVLRDFISGFSKEGIDVEVSATEVIR